MSGVPKSERGESRLESQHLAYKIRKLIVKELLNDFGTKENTMPVWLIEEERKRVLDLTQGISAHLRAANTIWPDYMIEFTERRLQMDRALECCNMLQDELQAIVEMVPADKNRYTQIVLLIEKEYNLIKRLRQSDNRFLKHIRDGADPDSASNFGNVNNNGNANNNNASNSNDVRRDFTDAQKDFCRRA